MVVETLGHQLERQRVLLTGGFLDFGSLVLEPDFDLILVQLKLARKILAPFLRQVSVLGELVLQTRQLFGGEGRPRTLLFRLPVLLRPYPTRSRTYIRHTFSVVLADYWMGKGVEGPLSFE